MAVDGPWPEVFEQVDVLAVDDVRAVIGELRTSGEYPDSYDIGWDAALNAIPARLGLGELHDQRGSDGGSH